MDIRNKQILVLTVSDSCYQKKAEDKSGPLLEELVSTTFPTIPIKRDLVPDEIIEITETLLQSCQNSIAIFTTGGTGFSPRDVTPEATKAVIQRECPQLALKMALDSFEKTPFAALSRAACGIRNQTLIVNFPGSAKAVRECYKAIESVLPHALQLINNDESNVKSLHFEIQGKPSSGHHICPHKTGTGVNGDRNSPYPMVPVDKALELILDEIRVYCNRSVLEGFKSPVDIPPFRASVKDGYAMKSGLSGTKKVIGYISAGDEISSCPLQEDECFKINTGAPVPSFADCVVQIEDTKLLQSNKSGLEELVDILVEPTSGLDIRPIGCDLKKGSRVFPDADFSPVVVKSIMASIGKISNPIKVPRIAIVSTGSELLTPSDVDREGKIYDSNTTMLEELLRYFGFKSLRNVFVNDDFDAVKESFQKLLSDFDIIICSGGVSMGDKDYIKPVLKALGFHIVLGRVNMKPGKPMTFASIANEKVFFGLPGNPVSAFVTFHLFVLPALRFISGWKRDKCPLAIVEVELLNDIIQLDSRPEYARASVISRNGRLFATVNGDQMSSRLQSIIGAGVLLHLPGATEGKPNAVKGDIFKASVLRYDFISGYE